MIKNGLIEIKDFNSEKIILYSHNLAIEGFPKKFQAVTVFTDIPNSYLKSLLDFFHAETFRFVENGKTYSPFDWIELEKTNSIIVGFTVQENHKKLFKKILIKNEEEIIISSIGENNEN